MSPPHEVLTWNGFHRLVAQLILSEWDVNCVTSRAPPIHPHLYYSLKSRNKNYSKKHVKSGRNRPKKKRRPSGFFFACGIISSETQQKAWWVQHRRTLLSLNSMRVSACLSLFSLLTAQTPSLSHLIQLGALHDLFHECVSELIASVVDSNAICERSEQIKPNGANVTCNVMQIIYVKWI